MKTAWLMGLLSLLLMAVYGKVAGGLGEAAQSPKRPATVPARAAIEGSDNKLPAGLSEYVFLHQTRDENIPVHAMAGVKACEK